jgi:hypothetical protein
MGGTPKSEEKSQSIFSPGVDVIEAVVDFGVVEAVVVAADVDEAGAEVEVVEAGVDVDVGPAVEVGGVETVDVECEVVADDVVFLVVVV